MDAVQRGIDRDGAFYLLSLRLVPVVPFFVVNLLMALTRIRPWMFYWVSQLGMLPATLVYVNAGTRLGAIESVGDVLSAGLLGAFALLALLPLLLRLLLGWLQRRRALRGHHRPRRFDYNLIVIGAGSAGLVSAYVAAAGRARVALIEQQRMGGDCLNTGCVPSKALIRSAALLADARDSRRYGIRRMDAQVDFREVMDRVQDTIRQVAPHDSVERYAALGVDCIAGRAQVLSPWEVDVDGRRLSARELIIATGARPTVPTLPGLESVPYLTSDTVWDLREAPGRLLVLGGGPVGCELAQAFARLGCTVTVVQKGARLLPREDADASAEVEAAFAAEGIAVHTGHRAVRVEPGDGVQCAHLVCASGDGEVRIPFDRLLLALGRTPNTRGFGLETLDLRVEPGGTLTADAFMRTSVPTIRVCGDVAGPYQFTHVASHQAWHAAVNALLAPWWSFRTSYAVVPWCTFTDPEVARVGLSEAEARERSVAFEATRFPMDDLDRAIADSDTRGYVKVLTVPGRDRILGATVVGRHAGETIAPFVLAMRHGLGLGKLLSTIHVYPTRMEANKYVAGAWRRAHAPERLLRVAARFHRWRRG
jgi:pyruvate/2-oxoglutarate dehydrogenase complex dihydrolipoamide dehydrogenase (E3) component